MVFWPKCFRAEVSDPCSKQCCFKLVLQLILDDILFIRVTSTVFVGHCFAHSRSELHWLWHKLTYVASSCELVAECPQRKRVQPCKLITTASNVSDCSRNTNIANKSFIFIQTRKILFGFCEKTTNEPIERFGVVHLFLKSKNDYFEQIMKHSSLRIYCSHTTSFCSFHIF